MECVLEAASGQFGAGILVGLTRAAIAASIDVAETRGGKNRRAPPCKGCDPVRESAGLDEKVRRFWQTSVLLDDLSVIVVPIEKLDHERLEHAIGTLHHRFDVRNLSEGVPPKPSRVSAGATCGAQQFVPPKGYESISGPLSKEQ